MTARPDLCPGQFGVPVSKGPVTATNVTRYLPDALRATYRFCRVNPVIFRITLILAGPIRYNQARRDQNLTIVLKVEIQF